jgi:hypothetical protein
VLKQTTGDVTGITGFSQDETSWNVLFLVCAAEHKHAHQQLDNIGAISGDSTIVLFWDAKVAKIVKKLIPETGCFSHLLLKKSKKLRSQ